MRVIGVDRARFWGTLLVMLSYVFAPASAEARRVNIRVVATADPPSQVELQGSIGRQPFTKAEYIYSLDYHFTSMNSARMVISYKNASAVFTIRPLNDKLIELNLNAGGELNCHRSTLEELERNARSEDQSIVFSAAVRSELISGVVGHKCDKRYADRLDTVRVETRCRLAILVDIFDISYISDIKSNQNKGKCRDIDEIVKYKISKFKSNIEEKIDGMNSSQRLEVYKDISALINDYAWSTILNTLPREVDSLRNFQVDALLNHYCPSSYAMDNNLELQYQKEIKLLSEKDIIKENDLRGRLEKANCSTDKIRQIFGELSYSDKGSSPDDVPTEEAKSPETPETPLQ